MENKLMDQALNFAVEIDKLAKSLYGEREYISQIKRSSSSIYANICEANYGHSVADMISKFEIALKECNETEGWLRIFKKRKIWKNAKANFGIGCVLIIM